ncbi:MAG: hypothetical protein ACFFCT_08510 [Candidatus Odinarchaeota archaeon]
MSIELRNKFMKAASKYSSKIGDEEETTLIHRTSWVRILLERLVEDSPAFSIEVEVAPPQAEKTNEEDTSWIFDKFAEHLQYLENLRNHGFKLSVIKSGCILCASKVIHDVPEENLFRALIPP